MYFLFYFILIKRNVNFFYIFNYIFTYIFNKIINYNKKQYCILKIKSPLASIIRICVILYVNKMFLIERSTTKVTNKKNMNVSSFTKVKLIAKSKIVKLYLLIPRRM